MKVVILCGGKGTRMRDAAENLPKPLVRIGEKPILWHIMKIYQHYGFNDFVLLLGYKGEKIKEYFMDYSWKNHDFILDMDSGADDIQLLQKVENWKITFIDTGLNTMTGARIKRAQQYIGDAPFMLTYGDGLADIDLHALLTFHKEKGKIGTVTGISKKSQYGTLTIQEDVAQSFQEKEQTEGVINGGFFVFNPGVFHYLREEDHCILEQEPMRNLVADRELAVYQHRGLWIAMDTYKDLQEANQIWHQQNNSWKVW
ncbi:glucose-1-phosphate cytidylyltransferase [Geosporobacter ferrireducens]|uniref:Glucose-1-phosphate cytidylyltransferase n=1 Tax=Geosporobacter ferrireducens TaxID=1424294 RepID=A0A1D8GPH0_9FIRM|nr:glucose-1-phosphate cytidylyltransferase [Geosporobacter ferrireducens]AOT72849.1 glucose-1-phosphate cytidylyltransferase [Geosporobacter ferrireducens]MTI55250.1 glucose-1-phosphate cytidylyltransferase [Geosporobacter ferrireducens]